LPRLFYALEPDADSRDALAGLQRRLAFAPPRGVRVLATETLHVTLSFLGEIDASLIPALAAAPEALAPTAPRAASARALTGYPSAARAAVTVLELADDGGAMAALASALDRAPPARPFRAHVTVARARDRRDVRAWVARIDPPAEIRFAALTLFESKTLPTGPVYTALARAELTPRSPRAGSP
jgi:2'-5' RNA ligase